jgi:hypothetical protein
MPLQDARKKVSGFFVEVDPADAVHADLTSAATPAVAPTPVPKVTKTVEQIAREQPGPNLDEIKAPETPSQPIERADGSIDFNAIYSTAGLPSAPFTAEKVLEILGSLPAELPLEAKRATMKVTLGALAGTLGVTPETVVADASRKLTALGAYAETYTQQAATSVEKAQAEIARMEAEIERRKESIEAAKSRQLRMVQACDQEADRLDDVLEFFSLDTGASKHAPPTA